MVDVGEFNERHARYESEAFFDDENQDIGEGDEQRVDGQGAEHAGVDARELARLHELHGAVGHGVAEEHPQRRTQQLGALAQLADGDQRHEAGGKLDDEEVPDVVVERRHRHESDHVGEESGARIEEHQEHYRYDGEGHDVDAVVKRSVERRAYHHEAGDQQREHHHHPEIGEIVAAEERYEAVEHAEHQQDDDGRAYRSHLPDVEAAFADAAHLALIGLQIAVDFRRHGVAALHDFRAGRKLKRVFVEIKLILRVHLVAVGHAVVENVGLQVDAVGIEGVADEGVVFHIAHQLLQSLDWGDEHVFANGFLLLVGDAQVDLVGEQAGVGVDDAAVVDGADVGHDALAAVAVVAERGNGAELLFIALQQAGFPLAVAVVRRGVVVHHRVDHRVDERRVGVDAEVGVDDQSVVVPRLAQLVAVAVCLLVGDGEEYDEDAGGVDGCEQDVFAVEA